MRVNPARPPNQGDNMKCETEGCNHKATTTWSDNPYLVWTHVGDSENLCQCCVVKRIEDGLKDVQENLKKQKAELTANPCEITD